jgi:hypothetical protein
MMLKLYQRKALLAIMLAATLGAATVRTASAGSDPATIKKIIDEGRTHSELMKNFEYLTDVIGPRLTAPTSSNEPPNGRQSKCAIMGSRTCIWKAGRSDAAGSGASLTAE